MKQTSTGYAPIADNGKLWINVCEGDTFDLFKIYRTKESAEKNCLAGDVVKTVTITVEDES